MQENGLGVVDQYRCSSWTENVRRLDPIGVRLCEKQYREDGDALSAYECVTALQRDNKSQEQFSDK